MTFSFECYFKLGWEEKTKWHTSLVKGPFNNVECWPFLRKGDAEIQIYSQDGSLILYFTLPGPSQSSFFFPGTDGMWGWKTVVVVPLQAWIQLCGACASGGVWNMPSPITSFSNLKMKFVGSWPTSLPSGMHRLDLRDRFSRFSSRSSKALFWAWRDLKVALTWHICWKLSPARFSAATSSPWKELTSSCRLF